MEYNLWHTNRKKKSGEVHNVYLLGAIIGSTIINVCMYVRLFSPYANHSQYQFSAGEDK